MKYKKNKLRFKNEIALVIQGFYSLVKFSLVLISISKFYRQKCSSMLLRKICSIHYFYLPFEKHVSCEVLKDFYVENLETTPSTFCSKFSSEIYLSRIINYWDSIFLLYLTWGAFSLVCVLSVLFFLFFLSCFFFFSFSLGIFFDKH